MFIQGCRQGCGHPSRCSPQGHSPKIRYANTTNHPSVRCKLLYLRTCQYPGLRTGLRVFRKSLSRSGMTVNIARLHALMAKVHTQHAQQWRTLPLSITSYSNRPQATTISISQPRNNGSEEAAALLPKAPEGTQVRFTDSSSVLYLSCPTYWLIIMPTTCTSMNVMAWFHRCMNVTIWLSCIPRPKKLFWYRTS